MKLEDSNFTIEPLYITSPEIGESARGFKITNVEGDQVICDLNPADLSDARAFRSKMLSLGNFTYWGSNKMFMIFLADLSSKKVLSIKVWAKLGRRDKRMFVTSNRLYIKGLRVSLEDGIWKVANKGYKLQNKIDYMILDHSEDDINPLLKDFITKQFTSLNSNWDGLIALSWLRASLYASFLIENFGFFPFLLVVGEKGSGKNFFCQTLLRVLGITTNGEGIPSSTAVGILRRATQMVDVPLWLDEYSDNYQGGQKIEGILRSAFNRSAFVKADLGSATEITTTVCTSTFILSGESMSSDPATKDRFINVVLDKSKQNLEAKNILNDLYVELPKIGDYWIDQMTKEDLKDLKDQIQAEIKYLSTLSSEVKDTRLITSYAFLVVFLRRIKMEAKIDIQIEDLLKELFHSENEIKNNHSHIENFWDDFIVSVRKHDLINGINYYVTDDTLHLHWASVKDQILQTRRKQGIETRVDDKTLKLYLDRKYKSIESTASPMIEGEPFKKFRSLRFNLKELPESVRLQFE